MEERTCLHCGTAFFPPDPASRLAFCSATCCWDGQELLAASRALLRQVRRRKVKVHLARLRAGSGEDVAAVLAMAEAGADADQIARYTQLPQGAVDRILAADVRAAAA